MRRAIREVVAPWTPKELLLTRCLTAATELGRNTLEHGRGGTVEITIDEDEARAALRLVFLDRGPGIADLAAAMRDGFSSGGGLGVGLGGSKRLADAFGVKAREGGGTQVTVLLWLT